MANKRKSIPAIAVKRFYRPYEMAKIYSMDEKKIIELSYLCGALYQVRTAQLIHRGKFEEFMHKFEDFVTAHEGKYLSVADATTALGISKDSLLYIVAGAGAAYQVGRFLLINVEEAEAFIKKFRVDVPKIDLEQEIEIRRRLAKCVR